jgi:hypothetical protein
VKQSAPTTHGRKNHFRSREFVINGRRFNCDTEMLSIDCTSNSEPTNETPCSPISQIQDALLPVETDRDHGLQRELHTTGRGMISPRAAMADPQVVNCNRFSYQQVIHILPSLRAPSWYSTLIGQKTGRPRPKCLARSIPSEFTLLDRYIYHSVQDKPVIPLTRYRRRTKHGHE